MRQKIIAQYPIKRNIGWMVSFSIFMLPCFTSKICEQHFMIIVVECLNMPSTIMKHSVALINNMIKSIRYSVKFLKIIYMNEIK